MEKDPIIETRICRISGKEFSVTQKDVEFYKKISPKFGDYIAQIPYPTLCPEERQRRRLAFRNERKLYRRQCDASKKPIVSIYSPDKEYVVYDQKIWWSDERDAMDYGREFDFSKTFTQQFAELSRDVPKLSLGSYWGENSEYTNFSMYAKNCYMVFNALESEDCMYSRYLRRSKDVLDSLHIVDSSNVYGSILVGDSDTIYHSFHSMDCHALWYCRYCEGCSFCFGCVDLISKQYCIFNEQYSKEDYESKVEVLLGGITEQEEAEIYNFLKDNVTKHDHTVGSESISQSKYIRLSSGVANSRHIARSQDLKFCFEIEGCNDLYDCDMGGQGSSRCYEGVAVGIKNSACLFNAIVTESSNVLYSLNCLNGVFHCFGCEGLRGNLSYCILNKQYTKAEYEILVPKIIEHMQETGERGEFFDPRLSLFGYNETVAQEYYPLEKQDVVEKGYKWSDYEASQPQVSKTIHGSKLPETIKEVDDDILKTAIECEVTGKLFRIIPQELVFYRKHDIPLPRKHPDQRHLERIEMRK